MSGARSSRIRWNTPCDDASIMNSLRFGSLAFLPLMIAACGSADDAATPADDEALVSVCPLDADARAQAEEMLGAALLDASWISVQSPSHAPPVDRAFGADIPFTSSPLLSVAKQLKACKGAKQFEPQCPANDKASKALGAVPHCQAFACEEDGTLTADMWLEPLPFAAAAKMGGQVNVTSFEHATRFHPEGENALTIDWSTRIGVSVADRALEQTVVGSAAVDWLEATSLHLDIELAGLAQSPVVATVDKIDHVLGGMASVDGNPVLIFDDVNGFSWIGACTQ